MAKSVFDNLGEINVFYVEVEVRGPTCSSITRSHTSILFQILWTILTASKQQQLQCFRICFNTWLHNINL